MSEDAKYKKEIEIRKKEFQDKKIELISRLCAENPSDKKESKKKRPEMG